MVMQSSMVHERSFVVGASGQLLLPATGIPDCLLPGTVVDARLVARLQ